MDIRIKHSEIGKQLRIFLDYNGPTVHHRVYICATVIPVGTAIAITTVRVAIRAIIAPTNVFDVDLRPPSDVVSTPPS